MLVTLHRPAPQPGGHSLGMGTRLALHSTGHFMFINPPYHRRGTGCMTSVCDLLYNLDISATNGQASIMIVNDGQNY